MSDRRFEMYDYCRSFIANGRENPENTIIQKTWPNPKSHFKKALTVILSISMMQTHYYD